MKTAFIYVMLQCALLTACTKSEDDNINHNPATIEKSVVKGRITDSNGNPVANAKVVIENTVFLASYVFAVSGVDGYYKTSVPSGSWKASVQIQKNYQGQTYTFDLHPDNDAAFAGTNGAVRNFSWKLKGAKPAGGFYGGQVAVYAEPGSSIMMEDVQVTLTPDGPLVDGSNGQTITKGLIDIGGGEDGINDIPIGKYIITAKNTATGQALQVRIRNTGSYNSSVSSIFKPGFTGSTTYQVVIEVK